MAEAALEKPRWYGFDLLRFVCYFCIVEFHFGLFYFGTPSTKYIDVSWVIWSIDRLGHVLMLSGFIIAFLSSLLLALNRRVGDGKLRLFAVFALGWIYLSIGSYSPVLLTWDIFALFFSALLPMLWLEQRASLNVRILGVLGYALLWFPVWQLAPYLPAGHQSIKNVLGVALCGKEEVAEWPLLPWTGLIWFGYWVGAELRRVQADGKLTALRLGVKEAVLWGAMLAASAPQLGTYYRLRMGRYFSCEAYRQEPYIFWSHFVWVLLIVRLAVEPRVQAALARRAWVKWVSQLSMSRKFWLAYGLQYVVGMGLATGLNYLEEFDPELFKDCELPALEVIAVVLFPLNEQLTGLVWRGLVWAQAFIGRLRARPRFGQQVLK